jgi:putative methyltransferase (TIGR04325 family)
MINIRSVRRFLKGAVPLFIYERIKARRSPIKYEYGFKNWSDAKAASIGYSEDSILQKISSQTVLMVESNSGWVRDGFYFNQVQINYEILSFVALHSAKGQPLRVIDFGGGLGTSYFQNRNILEKFGIKVCWNIIEQPNFVAEGKLVLGSVPNLHFFETLTDASVTSLDLVLFSSVLEYLEDSYQFLEEIMRLEMKPLGILIDRSPIDLIDNEKYLVQNVEQSIHQAKLPLRILGQDRIVAILSSDYELLSDWVSSTQPDPKSSARGLYFLRKY